MKKKDLELEVVKLLNRARHAESLVEKASEDILTLNQMVASSRMYITLLAGRLLGDNPDEKITVSLDDVAKVVAQYSLKFEFVDETQEWVQISLESVVRDDLTNDTTSA